MGERARELVKRTQRLAAFARDRKCHDAYAFLYAGELVNAPAGHLPWFEVPNRQSADSVLVTGHWSALGLQITPNRLALDSGCLWGGHLTAVRLENRRVFQVDCLPGEALPLKK